MTDADLVLGQPTVPDRQFYGANVKVLIEYPRGSGNWITAGEGIIHQIQWENEAAETTHPEYDTYRHFEPTGRRTLTMVIDR